MGFSRRDGLVGWLEEVWPQIVQPLRAAKKDPLEIEALLRAVARPPELQPPWQTRFLAHAKELLSFLYSPKFPKGLSEQTVRDALNRPVEDEKRIRAANRLPTRRIANAMAGVPELAWSRSLDRCSQHRCSYQVAQPTAEYYRKMFCVPCGY